MLSVLPFYAQQTDSGQPRLTHHLSPAEAKLRHLIGRNFVETDPPPGNVFSLGEFERNTGVLIAYPGHFGIPTTLIREMARDAIVTTLVAGITQENAVRNIFTSAGVNLDNCQFIYAPTNSYWTRDYGPWYIAYGNNQIGLIDFPYNRNRPQDDEIPIVLANALGMEYFGMNIIQTGGNYMTTGMNAAASTTLVWEENPSQTQAQLNQKMQDYLGISEYLVVEDPNNTYIDHIDCWSKY
ncbi:MAG: agmatine deiminase family protein, partial [Lentimicrobiaceae bacterium]|nr:agmatine deiminase family protein [Lentimicrobiaceae bacterium]